MEITLGYAQAEWMGQRRIVLWMNLVESEAPLVELDTLGALLFGDAEKFEDVFGGGRDAVTLRTVAVLVGQEVDSDEDPVVGGVAAGSHDKVYNNDT